jgi:hypothetical protein
MKETLRHRIELMYNNLLARQGQLEHHVNEYRDEGKYDEAAKCQIKIEMIKMFKTSLSELLEG